MSSTLTIAGCVAFSPDGKIVASSHSPSWSTLYEGQVKLFSAQTGEELLTLKGHKHWVHKLVFSPDGKRLASTNGRASESWELKVWDAQTGEELLTFDKVGGGVTFSPDGHRLFSAGTEGLRIYDATPLPEKP